MIAAAELRLKTLDSGAVLLLLTTALELVPLHDPDDESETEQNNTD